MMMMMIIQDRSMMIIHLYIETDRQIDRQTTVSIAAAPVSSPV